MNNRLLLVCMLGTWLMCLLASSTDAVLPPSKFRSTHAGQAQSTAESGGYSPWQSGAESMLARVQELIQLGKFDEAEMICEEAYKMWPGDMQILKMGRRLAHRHSKHVEFQIHGRSYIVVVGKGDTAKGLMEDIRTTHPELSEALSNRQFFMSLHNEINRALKEGKGPISDEEHVTSRVETSPLSASHPRPLIAHGFIDHLACQAKPCKWNIYFGQDAANVADQVMEQCKCQDVARSKLLTSIADSLLGLANQLLERSSPFFHIDQLVANSEDGPLRTSLNNVKVESIDGLKHVAGALPLQRQAIKEDIQAQELLWKHQHPQQCKGKRFIVFNFDKAYWGLAANMNFLAVIFNYALQTDRIVITANPDHWNYAGNDCSAGWECYFRTLTNCTMQDAHEPYTVQFRDDLQYDFEGFVYQNNWNHSRVQHYANTDGPWKDFLLSEHHGWKKYIPPQFDHMSFKWWRSQLSRYAIRPKTWVLKYISSRRTQIQFDPKLVAIHVRHGDKSYDVVHQHSYFGGLSKYVERAHRLVQSAPTKSKVIATRFFLSTDDDEVVSEATKLQGEGLIDVIVDNQEKRYNGTHIYSPWGISQTRWPGFPGNDPRVNTTLYALETIKSIWLMQESKLFIGTVTSCFSRLIHQLRLAAGHWDAGPLWTLDHDPRSAMHGWHPDWIMDP